jgi:hypothetical protein
MPVACRSTMSPSHDRSPWEGVVFTKSRQRRPPRKGTGEFGEVTFNPLITS